MSDAETRELLIRLGPRTAHRICDELSICNNAMQSLIGDESVPAEIRSKISLVQSHTRHVANIARQFLSITGHREPPATVLDIREVLLEIESLIQRLLGNDIELRMTFGPDCWPIKADVDSLVSIFCALAANGRDAMPNGGVTCIRASNLTKAECVTDPRVAPVASDYVLIEFSDTGIGMPDDVADRILEPFFTTKGVGCGFGLATVYSKIKRMNGHILVDSELDHGTICRLLLPRISG